MITKQKNLFDVFSDVIQKLEQHQIEYMIVGSIASIAYGEPRMTKDMDLVIHVQPTQLKLISSLFDTEEYYCPPFEVLSDEFLRQGQFNIIHPESGLKVDFVFKKNTPHSDSEFSRRKQLELWPDMNTWVAAPEDVILKKLHFFKEGQSEKHIFDIKGILTQTSVDLEYIKKWVQNLDLESEWKRCSG